MASAHAAAAPVLTRRSVPGTVRNSLPRTPAAWSVSAPRSPLPLDDAAGEATAGAETGGSACDPCPGSAVRAFLEGRPDRSDDPTERRTEYEHMVPLHAKHAALPEGHADREQLRGDLIAGYLPVAGTSPAITATAGRTPTTSSRWRQWGWYLLWTGSSRGADPTSCLSRCPPSPARCCGLPGSGQHGPGPAEAACASGDDLRRRGRAGTAQAALPVRARSPSGSVSTRGCHRGVGGPRRGAYPLPRRTGSVRARAPGRRRGPGQRRCIGAAPEPTPSPLAKPAQLAEGTEYRCRPGGLRGGPCPL